MTPYRDRRHAGHYDRTSAHYMGSIGTSELAPELEPEPPELPAADIEPIAEPEPPEPIAEPEPELAEDQGDDPRATAKAIELAAAHGLDLASIRGSGLHARITVGDVDAALADTAALQDTDAAGGF